MAWHSQDNGVTKPRQWHDTAKTMAWHSQGNGMTQPRQWRDTAKTMVWHSQGNGVTQPRQWHNLAMAMAWHSRYLCLALVGILWAVATCTIRSSVSSVTSFLSESRDDTMSREGAWGKCTYIQGDIRMIIHNHYWGPTPIEIPISATQWFAQLLSQTHILILQTWDKAQGTM